MQAEKPNYINTAWLTRPRLRVRVVNVASPTLFWVQPETSRKDLEEMLAELEWWMARPGKPRTFWPWRMELGANAAVKHGKRWQRGTITGLGDNHVIVQLKDWGQTIRLPKTRIYELDPRFESLKWQAIPCSLASIRPRGPEELRGQRLRHWPGRTTRLFKALIEGRETWIQIKESVDDKAAYVELSVSHESGLGTRYVTDYLEHLGCVERCDQMSSGIPPTI